MKKMFNQMIQRCIRYNPFQPVHIGGYLRKKYFFRYMKRLPVLSFREVLDAGCGSGEYTLRLARAYPHIKITGYDIEESTSWNNPPRNVRFQCQDLLQLPGKKPLRFMFMHRCFRAYPKESQSDGKYISGA